jgi:hypothetical protein
MHTLISLYVWTTAAIVIGAGLLHLVPRLGPPGRWLAGRLCHAPGVDLVIAYFMAAPMIAGPIVAGWGGLAAAVAAQITGLLIWIALHELTHPGARSGPRIYRSLDRVIGPVRNHLAVWITSIAAPLFVLVRLAEILVYPPLTWLVGLPPYRHADWVNVSRHKFDGLVGYDRIWCLYCDWMTGVWSLGAEMLRNVESFWCPIRFYSDKKCENCRHDFPDVEAGWVPADAGMADVTSLVEQKYSGGQRGWFGHPVRLTVRGADAAPAHDADEPPTD